MIKVVPNKLYTELFYKENFCMLLSISQKSNLYKCVNSAQMPSFYF